MSKFYIAKVRNFSVFSALTCFALVLGKSESETKIGVFMGCAMVLWHALALVQWARCPVSFGLKRNCFAFVSVLGAVQTW